MAEEATNNEAAATSEQKPLVELVTERVCFPNLEAAGEAIAGIAARASDFDTSLFVTPGASFNDEGEFVPEAPEWTADTHELMLTPLATKAVKDSEGNVTKPARLIALVFAPIPTVTAAMDDSKGAETVAEVWRKEMNHRAVRKLRTAENVKAAATEMPLSLESFVTSQAGGGTTGLAAFDDHWLLYSQALAKKLPNLWGARFIGGKGKAAIRSAIENAAKAKALYPELEEAADGTSLFVRLLQAVIGAAKKAGQDTTLLEAWLTTRDEQTYDAATDAAADEVDFDSLFGDMAEDATDEDGEGDPPSADEPEDE